MSLYSFYIYRSIPLTQCGRLPGPRNIGMYSGVYILTVEYLKNASFNPYPCYFLSLLSSPVLILIDNLVYIYTGYSDIPR